VATGVIGLNLDGVIGVTELDSRICIDHILVANVGCDLFVMHHVAEVPGKIGSSTVFWLIACSARIVEVAVLVSSTKPIT